MNREKLKLSEIASLRTGKLDSNAAVEDGEYPFFTCAQETYRIDNYAFDTEAVLLGGNNAEGIFPLKYYNGKFNAYQRTYVIESRDKSILSTRYLYYALKPALSYFKSASIGAATQYLTKGILDNFLIHLPSVKLQENIVSCISTYDDLLDNNRSRIKLLEQSARLLFKEWFLELRYPGHEHDKIMDGVPEGWRVELLPDVSDIAYGLPFASKLFNEDGVGIPLARIRNIPDGCSGTCTSEEADSYYLIEDGDVLVGMDGDFHINFWTGGRAWLNQRVTRIRSKGPLSLGFLRYAIERPIRVFNETITGSTVSHLGARHLKTIKIAVPPTGLVETANDTLDKIRLQIVALRRQSTKAEHARNLLLPRLMDGRLSV
jgi:type I restriction enzyme S subunit